MCTHAYVCVKYGVNFLVSENIKCIYTQVNRKHICNKEKKYTKDKNNWGNGDERKHDNSGVNYILLD